MDIVVAGVRSYVGDLTVQRLVTAIKKSPAWRDGQKSAIIMVWDENDYSLAPKTNQVMLIVDTNYGVHGVRSGCFYTHFSLLKSQEPAFDLPCFSSLNLSFFSPLPLLYSVAWMELISPADYAKQAVLAIQDYALLAWRSLVNLFAHPRYVADTLMQADLIGVGSLPIVVLTGFFTGAVLALQTSNTLERFGSLSLTGQLVALSMVRELGPVLTGLMVSGRNASGMASELGSMVVTEQIDAMRALGTDPSKKLVTPRVIAATTMLFFLTIISDLVGLTGGWAVSRLILGLDSNQYWTTAWQSLRFSDIFMGLLKPTMFGYIIATVGCYYGLSTKGGTQGVGRATTQAVVTSSVLILVADFFVTKMLMAMLES